MPWVGHAASPRCRPIHRRRRRCYLDSSRSILLATRAPCSCRRTPILARLYRRRRDERRRRASLHVSHEFSRSLPAATERLIGIELDGGRHPAVSLSPSLAHLFPSLPPACSAGAVDTCDECSSCAAVAITSRVSCMQPWRRRGSLVLVVLAVVFPSYSSAAIS